MQTLSFHQSNRAPTERLIFNCHQEANAKQPSITAQSVRLFAHGRRQKGVWLLLCKSRSRLKSCI
jgi:hypothetical protein